MKTILTLVAVSLAWVACAPTPASSPRTQPTAPAAAPGSTVTSAATAASAAPGDGANPASERPKSIDELVTRALAAIKAGDGQAYGALMFTQEDVTKACPELLKSVDAELLAKMARSVSERVAECGQLEWAEAKQVGRSGGQRKHRSKDCSHEVWELQDVKMTFQIGGEEVQVKLDDPLEFPDGTFAFADNPRCGAPLPDGPKPPVPDAPVPDAPAAPAPLGPSLPETPQ